MKQVFWLDEPHTGHPALNRDISVDAVVVGAGICGVSAAYALEKEGMSVALIDSRTIFVHSGIQMWV